MKDAEQPSATRSDAKRTWSSHDCEGEKPYFEPTIFDGKLSKVHIPSSARTDCVNVRHAASAPTISPARFEKFFTFIFIFLPAEIVKPAPDPASNSPPSKTPRYSPHSPGCPDCHISPPSQSSSCE